MNERTNERAITDEDDGSRERGHLLYYHVAMVDCEMFWLVRRTAPTREQPWGARQEGRYFGGRQETTKCSNKNNAMGLGFWKIQTTQKQT